MKNLFELIGRYFLLMGKVFSKPEKASIYGKRILAETESLGLNSIGIVAIISVFMGAVITIQMALNLESPFIPKYLIGYAARESMLLEFSSTVVALILAGKVGSNIASEIGTMRITEQIDALEIMGVNSASYLILPKIVSTVFFFPFLTILSMIIGVAGGYVVSILTGAVNPDSYIIGIQYDFKPFYITYSLIKSSTFAFIITSISGFYGYYADGNSLEVGRASTKAVVVSSIVKSFDGRVVLDDISAEFSPGITNLIIGQSGSGKTVLLKSLVGLHKIDSGSIYYDDVEFNRLPFKEMKAIREKVGMIFQGGALLDSSNVEENVRLPLDLFTSMPEDEKRDRVNFCLKRVNLSNVNRLYPAELSGGMIKRVAIARAIVLNPQYLFCDEPNSGLDPMTSVLIDNLIHEITQEYNITTVINTHDMNSVLEIGEHILFIYKGRKWWEGSKHDILDADNRELNDFVFASAMAKRAKKAGL